MTPAALAGAAELAARLEAAGAAPEGARPPAEGIRRLLLGWSPRVREGNFEGLGVEDLDFLFRGYDDGFFGGALGRATGQLRFRLAPRMTRSGGKTFQFRPRGAGEAPVYEIAVSTHLLFRSFRGGGRPVEVNGLPCRDRLDALQRIFEHELLHLAELLAYGASSCKTARFRSLARRLFGHRDVTHRLVTAQEWARDRHGLRVGDRVSFTFEGRRLAGLLHRVTKRATVLVEDREGTPYTDGRRYRKFYVPLPALERAG
ncbi:MAG: hypothetical protein SCH98_16065 [Deferrisomatales bacterium]|nr:hypothetical protein [Deferrisomatales bacterium]